MCLNFALNYANYDCILYSKKFFSYEVVFIEKFLKYFKATDSLDSQYEDLIHNLDKNSIDIINKIIERINSIYKPDIYQDYNFFSKNEKKEIFKNYTKNHLKYDINTIKYDNIYFPSRFGFQFDIWNSIYKSGLIFLKKSNMKHKDIIDVGAFIGDSALFLKKYTNANIFCIEPDRLNFKIMQFTLALNKVKDIKCFNIAMGNKIGKDKFFHTGISSSFIYDKNQYNSNNIRDVNVTTLDNFVIENNINPKIIKINAVGAERQVLSGAYNTLKNYRPIVLVSLYHNPEVFFLSKQQIESMDLNYEFKIVKPNDGLILRHTTLIAEPVHK